MTCRSSPARYAAAPAAGREPAVAEVKPAGRPVRVALAADRSRIQADGNDLSFVTVTVRDSAGVDVPTAEPLIRFWLTGNARVVGVDNGDAMSHTSFQAGQIRLFNGKALVIVRAGTQHGAISLRAEGDGLQPVTIKLSTVPR